MLYILLVSTHWLCSFYLFLFTCISFSHPATVFQ